jgi:soluble lytic murein transglycosylase-like protein
MDLFAKITAIETRIAEITGSPPPEAPHSAAFSSALARLISPAASASGAASEGPAPVAPAEIDALVEQNAATWQVEPALIKAVIANESGFNARATSSAGAQGLMQLMPETAAAMGVRDPYDPAQNVAGGTRYLRSMLDRFKGDQKLAVAAYNAGPGAVEQHGGIPPYAETRTYVDNVLGSYARYRAR